MKCAIGKGVLYMFYPIPSLGGKYEMDEKGIVRNARTKRVVKTAKKESQYYILSINNKCIGRCREALMAEIFGKEDDFLPVASLDNNYEINQRGILRNTITKKRLKLFKYSGAPFYSVRLNGKYSHRYLQQLLWEVHGVLPKVNYFRTSISVCIQKDGGHFSFGSMTKCAKFLATREYYSFSWFNHQLQKRRTEICGWKIFYREEEKRTIRYTKHGL